MCALLNIWRFIHYGNILMLLVIYILATVMCLWHYGRWNLFSHVPLALWTVGFILNFGRLRWFIRVEENKRNVKSRKNQKLILTSRNEEQNNAAICRQCSSSYCSEDDSNASRELNAGVASASDSKGASVLNSNGKTRAIRGVSHWSSNHLCKETKR